MKNWLISLISLLLRLLFGIFIGGFLGLLVGIFLGLITMFDKGNNAVLSESLLIFMTMGAALGAILASSQRFSAFQDDSPEERVKARKQVGKNWQDGNGGHDGGNGG